ncbi:unnamed protein product [Adineta steineri]|uniref:Uncharacterized protein n=1 Tax=Adineta steineri TaxID=433720 RepID=A0A813WZT7_9BILA|nr:unnamed protein product [Adineta steineri]CAF0861165.1 unnamed protein product [Adineta steineri]CAF1446608.1 unnamed protein product [Adineta steineri]CAF3779003.1 unnamed protein product [Adineta steineri]CAF3923508.1 unnamed protein product [Adineta steineri]
MKSAIKILSIILILLALSFSVTNAASSCYSCTDCGTSWDISKTTVVATSGSSDYCRKTVTGNTVTKDYASSCTPANILGNGIFCCQTDLCNSGSKQSITVMNLGFLTASIWAIYHYMY